VLAIIGAKVVSMIDLIQRYNYKGSAWTKGFGFARSHIPLVSPVW